MWSRFKSILWEWRVVAIATPSVAGFVILLRFLGLLQILELSAYDLLMRQRPRLEPDPRIVIVGVDEKDYKQIGTGRIPDQVLADLINVIKAQQPRAIGLDFYRSFPVPPGTEELDAIYRDTPNLIGIQKAAGDDPILPSPILSELGQVGANDVIPDGDNKVRRGLLSLDTPEEGYIPSFGLFLALKYLGAEGFSLEVLDNGIDWRIGEALVIPFSPNDGGYIRSNYKFKI
jgi:adenylate cyclase